MLSTFVSPKFSKIETLEQFYQHYHKYGSYFIEPKEMAESIAYREGRGAWIAFGNPDARKELPLHVGNLNTVLNFLIKEKLFVDMDVTHIHVAIFEKLPTKDTATVTRLWTYWKEGSDWFWQDLSKQAHLFYLPPLSSVIERNGKMKLDMLIERLGMIKSTEENFEKYVIPHCVISPFEDVLELHTNTLYDVLLANNNEDPYFVVRSNFAGGFYIDPQNGQRVFMWIGPMWEYYDNFTHSNDGMLVFAFKEVEK